MISFVLAVSLSAPFYDQHASGWFWYEDPPMAQEEPKTSNAQEAEKPEVSSKYVLAKKSLEAFKKDLEDKKTLAIVNPTLDNVRDYMIQQKQMVYRSSKFQEAWQKVVLTTPELNYEREYPTAQYARHVQEDQDRQQRESKIKNLSQEFGLFYFFSSNCKYCQGFSPIVKAFSAKYGWDIMAISLDGGTSEYFEQVQRDNGMASALQIKAIPALVAFNAATGEMIPISYAMTSLDQLEQNIMTLVGSTRKD